MFHLACGRLLVNPALSALLEFEVLDGIRYIDGASIQTGLLHCPVKELSGWPHEWTALLILLIARLLAYERHCST